MRFFIYYRANEPILACIGSQKNLNQMFAFKRHNGFQYKCSVLLIRGTSALGTKLSWKVSKMSIVNNNHSPHFVFLNLMTFQNMFSLLTWYTRVYAIF